MGRQVTCARCKRTAEGADRFFLPPDLGEVVRENVCADCWRDWLEEQTRIINEMRLDLSQPSAHEVVHRQMRVFLDLPGANHSSDRAAAED